MKKIALCIPLAVILAAVWAFAAGDAGDPLASLSYLNGEFTRTVEQKTDQALDDSVFQLAGNPSERGRLPPWRHRH